MSKSNLDRMLENAVAKAIGLTPPHKLRKLVVPARRATHTIKRAA